MGDANNNQALKNSTHSYCCAALRNLAANADNKVAIAGVGRIEVVMTLLQISLSGHRKEKDEAGALVAEELRGQRRQ